MKYLIIYLFTMVNVLAGFPPMTVKSQNDTVKQTTFNLEAPNYQATSLNGTTKLIETGNNNVIKDPGFEGNSLEWVTYADAAGTAPVDGTGGTANVTIAYTTTNPLNGKKSMLFTKDAANRQGQGTSLNFTIPDINKGKVNNIKISYDIASGTYATGDLTMWVINVDPASATNGRVIQPSAYTIENSGLKESKFLEFQSDIDSNLYRLVVHVTSTSASAYSLRFDDVSVGLGPKIFGSVTTDWVEFPMVIQGSTTNPTKATSPAIDKAYWRRVGDSMEIKYDYQHDSATGATAGSGSYRFLLPSGYTIDLNKLGQVSLYSTLGSASGFSTSKSHLIGNAAYRASATYFSLVLGNNSNAVTEVGSTFAQLSEAAIRYSFTAKVPIQGWSTTQQLSNDADTRVVSFNAATVSPIAITNANAGTTKLVFTSVYDDSHGSYNASTGEYTVKVPGVYQVYAKTRIVMASGMQNLAVYKNSGGEAYGTTAYGAATVESDVSWQGKVVAGDVISIRTIQTSGSGTATVGNGSSTGDIFFIAKLSGPSQIAASESILVRATQSSGQSIANTGVGVDLTWNNITYDSHGSFNGATGEFTAPISGKYKVLSRIRFASNAWTVANEASLVLVKNGATYSLLGDNRAWATITVEMNVNGEDTVSLLAGEKIKIQAINTRAGGSASLSASSTVNFVTIERVGNY